MVEQTELKNDNAIFVPADVPEVHTAELECWRCRRITTDWFIKDAFSYCKECFRELTL